MTLSIYDPHSMIDYNMIDAIGWHLSKALRERINKMPEELQNRYWDVVWARM